MTIALIMGLFAYLFTKWFFFGTHYIGQTTHNNTMRALEVQDNEFMDEAFFLYTNDQF